MAGMDFKSAGARVRSLIASKKPSQLQTSALKKDVLRDNIVGEAIADSQRFQAAAEQIPTVEYEREQEDGSTTRESFAWDTFPEAIRDAARAGFSWEEPEVVGRDRVRPSHMFNRDVLSSLMASEDFVGSRPYTRDNAPESLFGAMAAANTMREKAQEVAAHVAQMQEMGEHEQELDDADRMLKDLRERAKGQYEDQGEVDPGLVGQIKDQAKRKRGAQRGIDEVYTDYVQSGGRAAASKLGKQAAADAADAVEAISSVPGLDPGQARNLPPEARIALAEKWAANPLLRKMAQIIGRLVRDMRMKRQARSRNVAVEPVGITTGRSLARMLPHELARGHMPELFPIWLKDYSERSLLEWEMAGKAPAGKGPIIYVMDGSGSMSGEPMIWASSVGLAIATIAQREKRAFAGIEFGSPGQVKAWFFPARKPVDPDELLDFATHFFGGGTSNLTGMQRAKKIIDEQPEFKTADVVLASDGQDTFRDADRRVRDELRTKGVRIHGISILCPGNAYLSQMCEYVVDVMDLAGSNDATDALAENLT